jgi:competence protein ComGB
MASLLKRHFLTSKNELTDDEQLRLLKRLHRLLETGYPLIEALEVISWDKQLRYSAKEIMNILTYGKSLDQALQLTSFHPSITSYLSFAKSNQNLQENIKRCCDMFERRQTYTRKFKHVIRYPVILFIIFVPILFLLKQAVIPSFIELYKGTPGSSPILVISLWLIDLLGVLLIVLLLLIFAVAVFWKIYRQRLEMDKQIQLYERIPFYRSYLRLQTSFMFASQFSTLIKTGLSFKDILEQMTKQKKQPIISYYSSLMINQLSEGRHLSTLLSQFRFLEKPLTDIFQKNNNTETLEMDLMVYAEVLMEETERKIVRMMTYIQPVFFIIIGCFVLFIYLTLMWPMFQLIKTI